jgi:hypothetical protein
MSTGETPRKVLPTPDIFDPLDVPMELRCGACGRVGSYQVGRLCMDPTVVRKDDPDSMDEALAFTRYFHCAHCGAGGPWELTRTSRMLLETLMEEALRFPKKARLHMAKFTLFDGTTSRWPTQAEAHLKQLIEKDPSNAFLWNRLGNLYQCSEAPPEKGLEAFRKAVARNEHDVESLHSIAQIYQELGQDEEAARWFHQFLLHARHAPAKTPRDLLRNLVRHAVETLLDLHMKSDKKIPLFPTGPLPGQAPGAAKDAEEPEVLYLTDFDLNKEEDWERMVDWWVTGAPPGRSSPAPRRGHPPKRHSPRARPALGAEGQVGRNDPCPCGSGRKYKNCCMRR